MTVTTPDISVESLMPADTVVADTPTKSSSSSRSLATTYNKKAADVLLEQELLDALNIIPDAKMKTQFYKGLNAFLKAYGSTSGSRSG